MSSLIQALSDKGFSSLATVGDLVLVKLTGLGRMGLLAFDTACRVVASGCERRALITQLHFVGARSVVVIVVAGAFVGMVVALQFYDTLVRFGSVSLLGAAVGLSLIRELAPVLAALIIIGRAGSAICAELAIMRSDSQIDALECMAIDPYRYLLAPRILAFIVAVPMLTAMFTVVGIIGGYFVAVVLFETNHAQFFQSMQDKVTSHDLTLGMTKSIVFGTLIAWICTAKGFLMHYDRGIVFGAQGISRVTTEAVVIASIAVLFADYITSALML